MATNPQIRAARLESKAEIAGIKSEQAAAKAGIESVEKSVVMGTGETVTISAARGGIIRITLGGQTFQTVIPEIAELQDAVKANAAGMKKLRADTGQGFLLARKALEAGDKRLDLIEKTMDKWGENLENWLDGFHGEAAMYRDQGTAFFDLMAELLNGYIDIVNVPDVPGNPMAVILARGIERWQSAQALLPGSRQALATGWGSAVRAITLAARIFGYSTTSRGLTSAFITDNPAGLLGTTTTTPTGGVPVS